MRPVAAAPAPFRPLGRILVSDDDPALRLLYGSLLTEHGFEYVGAPAGDGRATLELAMRVRPQLLITDVHKPGLDGYALRAALRDDPATAHLPVLMVSTQEPWSDGRRARPGPLDDYLLKPFLAESLIYRVAALLPLAEAEHDRLAERACGLPCYAYDHPVTGLPCLHARDERLRAATGAQGWAAVSVALASYPRLVRAVGRAGAEDVLTRLGAMLARLAGPGLLVAHTGLDPQLAVVGPAGPVAAVAAAIGELFAPLARRVAQLAPQLAPPRLSLRRVDDRAGEGLGLVELRRALRAA